MHTFSHHSPLQAEQLPHLVRTSLLSFLLLCIVVLSLFMLLLGFFFQIGAWLSPWLIVNGWSLLKFSFALLFFFRLSIALLRLAVRYHHQWQHHTNYRIFLTIVHGTIVYLYKAIPSLLKTLFWIFLQ